MDSRRKLPSGFALWVALSFCSGFALAVWAGEAMLFRNDGDVRINAPDFHFLEGKSLERAKDGQSVLYVFQVQLAAGSRQAPASMRIGYKFWLSYDLWEERFVVTDRRERATFRSTSEAEAWCLARSPINVTQSLRSQPLWLKLEVWADENSVKETAFADSGIDLRTLIDYFSRNPKRSAHWALERGPFQWGDLKQGS